MTMRSASLTTFADAIKAQGYGLATDKMSANLADAVAKINAAHQQAVNSLQAGADVSLLTAQGRTYEAQTYGMGSGRQKQLDDLRDQLTTLGLTAEEAAPWVTKLADAIDLSIQAVKDANAAQIEATKTQVQIDDLTAHGLTYQAAVVKQIADNAAAYKNLKDTLTALGVSAADAAPYLSSFANSLKLTMDAAAAANAEDIRQLNIKNILRNEAARGAAGDPGKKPQTWGR
jgi:hypothetical protein